MWFIYKYLYIFHKDGMSLQTTPCVEDSVAKIVCFCTTVVKHFRRELPHVTSAAMACAVCKASYFFGYTFFLRNFLTTLSQSPFPRRAV